MSIISNTSVIRGSANIATILFVVVIILQLLLAAGILPVSMAWGGRQEVLTSNMRVASIVSAVILGLFAYIIRRRSGLMGPEEISVLIKVLAWIVTVYMAFNTFTNLTSLSSAEKMIFSPITSVLTIVCFIVSISSQ